MAIATPAPPPLATGRRPAFELDADPRHVARRHREDGVVHRRRQEARVLVAELAEHAADLVVRRVARRVVLLHELLPHREPVLPGERAVDVLLVDLLPRAGDQFLLGRELGSERRRRQKLWRRRDEQKRERARRAVGREPREERRRWRERRQSIAVREFLGVRVTRSCCAGGTLVWCFGATSGPLAHAAARSSSRTASASAPARPRRGTRRARRHAVARRGRAVGARRERRAHDVVVAGVGAGGRRQPGRRRRRRRRRRRGRRGRRRRRRGRAVRGARRRRARRERRHATVCGRSAPPGGRRRGRSTRRPGRAAARLEHAASRAADRAPSARRCAPAGCARAAARSRGRQRAPRRQVQRLDPAPIGADTSRPSKGPIRDERFDARPRRCRARWSVVAAPARAFTSASAPRPRSGDGSSKRGGRQVEERRYRSVAPSAPTDAVWGSSTFSAAAKPAASRRLERVEGVAWRRSGAALHRRGVQAGEDIHTASEDVIVDGATAEVTDLQPGEERRLDGAVDAALAFGVQREFAIENWTGASPTASDSSAKPARRAARRARLAAAAPPRIATFARSTIAWSFSSLRPSAVVALTSLASVRGPPASPPSWRTARRSPRRGA